MAHRYKQGNGDDHLIKTRRCSAYEHPSISGFGSSSSHFPTLNGDIAIPPKLQNGNALKILRDLTKDGIHFGLNVVEYNESDGYVDIKFDNEFRFDKSSALTILGKKPCSLVDSYMIQDPLFATVLHSNLEQKKNVMYFDISSVFGKGSNHNMMIYHKKHRDSAIMQAWFHDFSSDEKDHIQNFFEINVDRFSEEEKHDVELYMIGKLFGYKSLDVMVYSNGWGRKCDMNNKCRIKIDPEEMKRVKRNFRKIVRIGNRILKNLRESSKFKEYEMKTMKLERPLYVLMPVDVCKYPYLYSKSKQPQAIIRNNFIKDLCSE